jgi:hypothetical protein
MLARRRVTDVGARDEWIKSASSGTTRGRARRATSSERTRVERVAVKV